MPVRVAHSPTILVMPVDAVSTFFATAAVVLAVGLLAVILLALAATVSSTAKRWLAALSESFYGLGPKIAFTMAIIAMAGSLYYSEVAGFIPCEYCWYQRIAMYPLVPILGIAVFTGDRGIRKYVVPVAGIGAAISIYHNIIEHFPRLAFTECSGTIPCTASYVWKFGFVGIPFMALVSFGVIITVLLLDRSDVEGPAETPTERIGEETP